MKMEDIHGPTAQPTRQKEYQAELRKWLFDRIHRIGMNLANNYSVSVCRSCNHRGLWGGEMRGVRATECAGCKNQTAHDFHPFSSLHNAESIHPESKP
jgi:hypothetical protein